MKNILFCGDKKVFDGILSCMLSILMRTESREPFCFYIFTMDISVRQGMSQYLSIDRSQAEYLGQIAQSYHPENRVERVDVTEEYEREFKGCPNEDAYCSPYTLLRLLADLLPCIPDKLLYLDVDILFRRDISLLYDIDVEDYEYAAARDHYGKYLVNPNYINAGVLLLNMRKIRETGLFEKARELIRHRKLVFADQSAIYRSTFRKKILPQRFNDQKFLHKHTVVRHFSRRLFYLPYPHTENIKQWQVGRMLSVFHYVCFEDILQEYIFLKKAYERFGTGGFNEGDCRKS